MIRRICLLVLGLVAAVLAVLPATASSRTEDPGLIANQHLRDDAHGRTTLHRDASGRLQFLGTAPGAAMLAPGVDGSDSVRAAARAQLNRYGAALGAAPGTSFDDAGVTRDSSGVDVVRYQQSIGGVPVLGGQVVLGLGQGRGLRSLQARVAPAATVTDARITSDQAARTALGLVQRDHRGDRLTVTDRGRWILDPATAGLALPGGARTVRRLEVGDGAGVRQLVLVDDQTGAVVFRTDLNEQLDRVVCNRNNVPGAETPCTSGFARTESDPSTGITDVDNAFDFAGATSNFYASIDPSIDLTTMLGVDVGGTKKLAATVRFCTNSLSDPCPFPNAFWDGTQMYYGAGYAAADDVVGHEMTHGVIDHYSALFYWGQSGAINESLADIIGEIIDHRTPTPGDSPTNWDLGEDLPGGPLRNMADPTTHGQPDSMTSPLYTDDSTGQYAYGDNGGVHTDSGVGTKTAYLISQGGTLNGVTVTGIDAGDPNLTKTAELYVSVIKRLVSGSDYAALADVLEQSCSDLETAGTFTADDCAAVHNATLATQLRTDPPNAAHAVSASTACPSGSVKRVLFDSEANANPASYWLAGTGWSRATAVGLRNATSGTDSWYGEDPATTRTTGITTINSVALPSGQPSYLSFENWYVLDYQDSTYYDGGTVEVAPEGSAPVAADDPTRWVNGPDKTLAGVAAGRKVFSGDSRGWAVSRLDLSDYAGQQIRPQFTLHSDSSYGFMGWYVDDIRIYTCDRFPSSPTALKVVGLLNGLSIQWAPPISNPAAVTGYDVDVWGGPFHHVAATTRSLVVKGLGTSVVTFRVNVRANSAVVDTAYVGVNVARALVSLGGTRSGSTITFRGKLVKYPRTALPGQTVKLQRYASGRWITVATAHTRRDGTFAATVTHKASATYRAVFYGTTNVVGSVSAGRRR